MKTHQTIAGNNYVVYSKNGGTVTDASGTLNKAVEAGDFLFIPAAPSDMLMCDDDDSVIKQANFKRAALALRLLGGGNNGLPAGYTRVEWLESTGTQYIMTGFFPDDSSAIELDINPVAAPSSAGIWVFANADADKTETGRSFKVLLNRTLAYFEFGDAMKANIDSPEYGIRRKVALQNGLFNTSSKNYEFPKQIFKDRLVELSIFRNPRDTTVTTVDIYACCLSKNSQTERNFIPAIDRTGTPCMFDLVTRKPFYNSGTGDFLYPGKETTATTYSLRRPRMYAQMTPHGIRRLYHVPRGYNGTPEEYAEEHGFKILVETPAPEEGYWAPVWHEREDCIELEWVETEPPAEEILTEA